jgi:peptide/nickel transport system permease protein
LSAGRRFLSHPVSVLSLGVLVLLTTAALAAPLIEGWLAVDANAVSLFNRFGPPSADACRCSSGSPPLWRPP